MSREQLAHELAMLYLSLYDNPRTEKQHTEAAFVGRYANTWDRILAALPEPAETDE